MSDTYDDEELEPIVLEIADELETEAEANAAGAELVTHGIGATVEPIPDEELEAEGASSGYRVMVLPHELRRARALLGLEEPEERPDANPEEPMKPVKGKTNWKLVAIIWLAAFIILPVLAFLLTYWVTSSS